jgi:hypothetical protein
VIDRRNNCNVSQMHARKERLYVDVDMPLFNIPAVVVK